MRIEMINRQRRYKIDRDHWTGFAESVLDQLGLMVTQAAIVFVSDTRIRQLNREYRAIDKPTDVLSFSYSDFSLPATGIKLPFRQTKKGLAVKPIAEPDYLGDVVISPQTAERYANQLGLTFDREVKTLILHGLLHLCGYDHETDNGEMELLEGKLRYRLMDHTN